MSLRGLAPRGGAAGGQAGRRARPPHRRGRGCGDQASLAAACHPPPEGQRKPSGEPDAILPSTRNLWHSVVWQYLPFAYCIFPKCAEQTTKYI
jgi:hypothetical protein